MFRALGSSPPQRHNNHGGGAGPWPPLRANLPKVPGDHLIHAIILTVASDDTHLLDHLTRRWICEVCEQAPATVPQIVAALRARGWRGGSGSLWSTVSGLAKKGWLVEVGVLVSHGGPSPLWHFCGDRRAELRDAQRRNAPHRLETDSELVLIPEALVSRSAPVVAQEPALLWGLRFSQSQLGLAFVLDPTCTPDERDIAVQALHAAGASPVRVHVREVLPRQRLLAYASALSQGSPESCEPAGLPRGISDESAASEPS